MMIRKTVTKRLGFLCRMGLPAERPFVATVLRNKS